MTERITPSQALALTGLKESQLDRMARKAVLSRLENLTRGRIVLLESPQRYRFGETSSTAPLSVNVTVHHPRFYSRLIFGGPNGAAEAYMEGLWSADDLTGVVRILALNRAVFMEMERGLARLTALLYKLYHLARKNTKTGSRKNILAHYDLGNDFYALFLDKTMTYSCGIFEHPQSSLEESQIAKYDRICRKLQLTAGDRVVEIGTGWGGFALHASQNYGVHVTTTTISEAQSRWARQRFNKAGLADRITLLKTDYRDLEGRFDKLVSIEMIEAVGHQFFDVFFSTCSRLLTEDGMMLLQAITIQDQVFDKHKRTVDFIKRYIFPGSCIPSIAAMTRSIARATDLKLFHLEDITPHYTRTLRAWRENFFINFDQVRAMSFPETFICMWE